MMGNVRETIDTMARGIQERLSARVAYSDPVTVEGVTVIPVARVLVGFGAGTGVGAPKPGGNGGEAQAPPTGEGAGGGGAVQPLGFIEVSASGARWVPLELPTSEVVLRALSLAAVLAPFGGRRGLLGRLFVLLAGQALAGRMTRPNLPPLPEGLRFGRFTEQGG